MQKEEGLLQTTIICGCYKVVKIIEPSSSSPSPRPKHRANVVARKLTKTPRQLNPSTKSKIVIIFLTKEDLGVKNK